jgi:hypothetical protein
VPGFSRTQPSKKVAIIKFQRGMQQGLLGRISRTTLMEYHVFGIISCVSLCNETVRIPHRMLISYPRCSLSKNSGCHYMVCGVQGMYLRAFCHPVQCCQPPLAFQCAGDFTRGLVEDPPKFLWTRQLKVSKRCPAHRRTRRSITIFVLLHVLVRGGLQYVQAVPPRDPHLHWNRHRLSALDVPAGRRLVPHLDRLGPDWHLRYDDLQAHRR